MAQSVLPFQFEPEFSESGVTSLAGLPAYLELSHVLGLGASIDSHLKRPGEQGYTDTQFILPLILMNLAGGDCVADLERLNDDPGFSRVLERVELHHLSKSEKRKLRTRWRKKRQRLIPAATTVFKYLESYCVPEEANRGYGSAFIPPLSDALRGLRRVNTDLLAGVCSKVAQDQMTLDMDATIKAVEKKEALCCYKGFPAFQPLNVWCDELEMVVHSEFRDGNVPAAFDNLRVLKESLEMLPDGVKKVLFRSDTAGYQTELLSYLAEGKHPKFGVIEFAIGAPVTDALRAEAQRVEEVEWKPLQVQDKKTKEWRNTSYEWAEVVFVPNWVAAKASNPEYRYIVTRELLHQQPLPGIEEEQLKLELGFQPEVMSGLHYKLYAMVTNRKEKGDEMIRWYRERCGKSEQAHTIMKHDLAGSQLPSKRFGVNAAWWQIMIIALNLNSAMKRLVLAPALGKQWLKKRLKAIRYHIISLPGRVVNHARLLRIKIGGAAALSRLRDIRTRIAALACLKTPCRPDNHKPRQIPWGKPLKKTLEPLPKRRFRSNRESEDYGRWI